MRVLAILPLVVAVPAMAEGALRPTPDYFASAIFDLSMAQALARSCTTVSIDPDRATERSEALLVELDADGFSLIAPQDEMIDPDAAIRSLQHDFVARYALSEPDEARVCDVAQAEMDAGTGIGVLLTMVEAQ